MEQLEFLKVSKSYTIAQLFWLIEIELFQVCIYILKNF